MINCSLAFVLSFAAYGIGTATAGGSSIIFLLLLTWVLPVSEIPIVIAFVGSFAGIYRAYSFRHEVFSPILRWLLPGTILGAIIGATVFSIFLTKNGEYIIKLLLACLLVLSGAAGFVNGASRKRKTACWIFLPCGFLIAIISSIIGGAPPIVNALYQRFELPPAQLIGTKSVNLFVLQLTKSVIYVLFIGIQYGGRPHGLRAHTLHELVIFSLVGSIGAGLAISLGKRLLEKFSAGTFNLLINLMLILFGIYFFSLLI